MISLTFMLHAHQRLLVYAREKRNWNDFENFCNFKERNEIYSNEECQYRQAFSKFINPLLAFIFISNEFVFIIFHTLQLAEGCPG